MPISNKITHIPLDSIVLNRGQRQRTVIDDSVIDLAYSIGASQWINPILVEAGTNKLIAGERRYTAVSLLRDLRERGVAPATAYEKLKPVSRCKVDPWQHWTHIPCQFARNLTDIELQIFEFRENHERQDLPWQDKAKAMYNIHAMAIKQSESRWSSSDTARLLGIDQSHLSRYLRVWRHQLAGDDKIQQIVSESSSARSALEAIERVTSRRQASPVVLGAKPEPREVQLNPTHAAQYTIGVDLAKQPDKTAFHTKEELLSYKPTVPILNADFHQWAIEYSGPPFNFIHCDFPYGIDYNTSASQGTAVDTKLNGSYEDSENVYWQLLDTLLRYEHKLLAPSAHIMFWFSQNLRRRTEQFFWDLLPASTIQDFLMIWHCSDNSGILPDPNRYGRRTYETAMLLTFGDRKIVQAKALSFASPRGDKRIHRSEKTLAVLNHFFSMFVDDSSDVLDPTCGSGTSIITAKKLGARSVLGLELDPVMHKQAVEYYNREVS